MYDSCSCVFNMLDLVKLLCRQAIMETITIVNVISEKSMHNSQGEFFSKK